MSNKRNLTQFLCSLNYAQMQRVIYAEDEVDAAKRFASEFIQQFPKEAIELKSLKVYVEYEVDPQESYRSGFKKKTSIFNVRPILRADLVVTLDRATYRNEP